MAAGRRSGSLFRSENALSFVLHDMMRQLLFFLLVLSTASAAPTPLRSCCCEADSIGPGSGSGSIDGSCRVGPTSCCRSIWL